jgi:hypothetical protein
MGNSQVALPSDPTSDHQPTLVCPICKSGNAKFCIDRFARCRACRAPVGPSRGKAKRGSIRCGKEDGGRGHVYSTKCFRGSACLIGLRMGCPKESSRAVILPRGLGSPANWSSLGLLVLGHSLYRE